MFIAQKLYMFTNVSLPDLVIIEHTKSKIEKRLKKLDNIGVHTPFECFYAAEVEDAKFVKSKLHEIFCYKRKRYNIEFFKADPYQVRAAIQLAEIKVITTKKKTVNDQANVKSVGMLKTKNGRENLSSFRLPPMQSSPSVMILL